MKKAHIQRKKVAKIRARVVGTERCCCDGMHHIVESLDDEGDMATMVGGSEFCLFACTEPARPDGKCHAY
jgi:hypothetical protein